jgi:chromosome segregation ATPase
VSAPPALAAALDDVMRVGGQLLDEEITPKLEALRKERTLYNEYQKSKAELERIQRFCVAYQYMGLRVRKRGPCAWERGKRAHAFGGTQGKLDSSQADVAGKSKRIAALEKEVVTLQSEVRASEGELQRVRAQRQKVRIPTLNRPG